MTHDDLVKIAAIWLRNKAKSLVVITEMSSYGSEEADAIGFSANGHTCLIECKASRGDFLADGNKYFRAHPEMGMGSERWYMTPPNLVRLVELPDGWGLLEASQSKVRKVRDPEFFAAKASQREISLLVSAIRRIGRNAPVGVSVKAYNYKTKSRATLGILDENLVAGRFSEDISHIEAYNAAAAEVAGGD